MKVTLIALTLLGTLFLSAPAFADAFQCTVGEGVANECTMTVTGPNGVARTVTIGEGQYYRPTADESVETTGGTLVYIP